jgi:pimeloyl-ACP methyl ester carboxylesterase
VLGVADSLGWPRFDLVGHDWGSAVAWMTAAAHSARLRTLTTVSTPHGAALVHALRDDPDQRSRSAYFELFRTPGEAERELLDEGGLRRLYDGLPARRIERYVERFSEHGALTAALNWYRAMRPPAKRGPITTPTLYVWSTGDAFIGETTARGRTPRDVRKRRRPHARRLRVAPSGREPDAEGGRSRTLRRLS